MATPGDKSIAQTFDRGLDVLERVINGTTRLDDLAAEMNLSRTIVHRLLTTLARRGYLQQVDGQGWKIGLRLVELAGDAISEVDPAGLLQEEVSKIANEIEDSVHLGVLQGDDILYLVKAHGRRNVQMISRVGRRIPAQNTALGKAILSLGDIDKAVERFSPDATMTPLSITSPEQYREALIAARTNGFALDNQEATLGITCVAVALPPAGQRPTVAALSISVPVVYMEDERMSRLVSVLKAHAPAVSRIFSTLGENGLTDLARR